MDSINENKTIGPSDREYAIVAATRKMDVSREKVGHVDEAMKLLFISQWLGVLAAGGSILVNSPEIFLASEMGTIAAVMLSAKKLVERRKLVKEDRIKLEEFNSLLYGDETE